LKSLLVDELTKYGAILFRDFPIKSADDFNELVSQFKWPEMPYVGGVAFRTNIVGFVHTSNESPADQPIYFHHEMIYLPRYPTHLFFFCEVPPKQGGETPVVLSHVAYDKISEKFPQFVADIKEKGVRYTRVMAAEDDPASGVGRSWKYSFKTSCKKQVEEMCKNLYEKIEWLDDNSLRTVSFKMPGVRFDERLGKWTWFNQIMPAFFCWYDTRNEKSKAVTFGDGTEFDSEIVAECHEILRENCVEFKWERGDVLFLDNMLVLHGRNTYIPPRRILSALFDANAAPAPGAEE
jgi:alpha-ketoglutarate-dependent taurine dioxygenase